MVQTAVTILTDDLAAQLHTYAERRLSFALGRFGERSIQETVDANLYAAIDHAVERIGRSFSRQLQRDDEAQLNHVQQST
jgi:hypothetical protein